MQCEREDGEIDDRDWAADCQNLVGAPMRSDGIAFVQERGIAGEESFPSVLGASGTPSSRRWAR